MSGNNTPLGITEVVLRDAHQSLFATRMRIDDMLPIAQKLDQIGYWSMESWGGATFDSCIRFLGEDPWDRIREIKKAMQDLGYDDRHDTSTPNRPQSNGVIERVVRVVKEGTTAAPPVWTATSLGRCYEIFLLQAQH